MMPQALRPFSGLILLLLLSACATSPTEAPPTPNVTSPIAGYLPQPLNLVPLLPPSPQSGSLQDKADKAALDEWQVTSSDPRWKTATLDAESYEAADILKQFAPALDARLTAKNAPTLIKLLSRIENDASAAIKPAKRSFDRTRPYIEHNIDRYCNSHMGNKPGTRGDSYPSGHAARGWLVAQILSQIAPQRTSALLARGADYGNSRVVCAVHYPSDVAAGQMAGALLFEKLMQQDSFRRDLEQAKAEYTAAKTNKK